MTFFCQFKFESKSFQMIHYSASFPILLRLSLPRTDLKQWYTLHPAMYETNCLFGPKLFYPFYRTINWTLQCVTAHLWSLISFQCPLHCLESRAIAPSVLALSIQRGSLVISPFQIFHQPSLPNWTQPQISLHQ